MSVQQTSVEAYLDNKFMARRQHHMIMEALAVYGPMYDEQISWRTGIQYSAVNPRRGELLRMGYVKQVGFTKNHKGKKVMLWGV